MKSGVYSILTVFLCVLVVFCDCTRRRGPSRNRQTIQSNRTSTSKSTPESKIDTIYMVVPIPMPDENTNEVSREHTEIILPSSKKLKPVVHNESLPLPPRIVFQRPVNIFSRDEYINYHDIFGEMKDLIIACDYDNSTVRNNAVALVSVSPGSFNLGQICDIFDFCYMNWSYVNDPITKEYFAKASETLQNGLNGDCDDFAILVCSMILAVGGEARISFAYNDDKGHAFAEVNIGETSRGDVEDYLLARYGKSELHYKEEDGGCWMNLDWWGVYPGSGYWDYQKGKCFNIVRNIYREY